jgi:hypothetical protein
MCLVARQATLSELPTAACDLVTQNLSSQIYAVCFGAWTAISAEVAEKDALAVGKGLTQLAGNSGGLEVMLGNAPHPLILAMQKCAEVARTSKPIAESLHSVVLGVIDGELLPPGLLPWIRPQLKFKAFEIHEDLWGPVTADRLLALATAAKDDDSRLALVAALGGALSNPDIAAQAAALFPHNEGPLPFCNDRPGTIKIPNDFLSRKSTLLQAFSSARDDTHRSQILRVIYALGFRGELLNDIVAAGLQSSSLELKVLSLRTLDYIILDGPFDRDRSHLPDFSPQLLGICRDESLALNIRSYAIELLPKAARKDKVEGHAESYEQLLLACVEAGSHVSSALHSIQLAMEAIPPESQADIIQRQQNIFEQCLRSSDPEIVSHAAWTISDVLSKVTTPHSNLTIAAIHEFLNPSILTFDLYRGFSRLRARFRAAAEGARAAKHAGKFRHLAKHFSQVLTSVKNSTTWSGNREMRETLEGAVAKLSHRV